MNPNNSSYQIGDHVAISMYLRGGYWYPLSVLSHYGAPQGFRVGVGVVVSREYTNNANRTDTGYIDIAIDVSNYTDGETTVVDSITYTMSATTVNGKDTNITNVSTACGLTEQQVALANTFYYPQLIVPQSYARMLADMAALTGREVPPYSTELDAKRQCEEVGVAFRPLPNSWRRITWSQAAASGIDETEF